jgi:hypothetical protein
MKSGGSESHLAGRRDFYFAAVFTSDKENYYQPN